MKQHSVQRAKSPRTRGVRKLFCLFITASDHRLKKQKAWTYLETFVYESLLIKLLKHPPYALHKCWIQSFIVVLKVNPSTHPRHNCLPFFGIPHDDASACLIVVGNAQVQDILASFNVEALVNLIFNWQSVAIPPEPPGHMMPSRTCISGNNVLHENTNLEHQNPQTGDHAAVLHCSCPLRRQIRSAPRRSMRVLHT